MGGDTVRFPQHPVQTSDRKGDRYEDGGAWEDSSHASMCRRRGSHDAAIFTDKHVGALSFLPSRISSEAGKILPGSGWLWYSNGTPSSMPPSQPRPAETRAFLFRFFLLLLAYFILHIVSFHADTVQYVLICPFAMTENI